MGGNENEIDFVLVDKNIRKYFGDVEPTPRGVATSAGGNRHPQKKVEETSEKRKTVEKRIREFKEAI